MADILLFHHVLGLTPGVVAVADTLRHDGHTVHTPDLFDGHVFSTIDDGFAFMNALLPAEVTGEVDRAAADLPPDLVYVGISWGVMHAQRLAQTRAGARGAVLFEACIPVTGDWAFGPWPPALPVQVHGMDDDAFFAHEGDLEAARELVASAGTARAEVFTYPGDAHLFVDSSLSSYDEGAAQLALDRARRFLREI